MTHSVTHSIMFHHFHNEEKHIPSPGSLNDHCFREMLSWLNQNYSLIGASDYREKFEKGILSSSDVCISCNFICLYPRFLACLHLSLTESTSS